MFVYDQGAYSNLNYGARLFNAQDPFSNINYGACLFNDQGLKSN